MIKRLAAFAFLFFAVFFPAGAQAETGGEKLDMLDEYKKIQLEHLGIDELQAHWDRIVEDYGGFLPEAEKMNLMDYLKGDASFSIQGWFKGIAAFAFQELAMNGKLLTSLILLTIFSVFLQSLHSAFESGGVSKAAYAVVFIVLILISLNSFRVASDYALAAIDSMTHFIYALLPLLLALIAATGGVASSAFFHPILVFLINTSGLLIRNIILPLLFFATLLSVTSAVTGQFKVTQLSGLLKKASIGLLGVFTTVLLGVLSLRGAAAAVADGVAVKTAKFMAGNFVPVVGRMFTDAADTIISASQLLKNTIGLAGAGIVLAIAAFPAVKIFIIAVVYKLAAALLQPLGDGPVIKCLDTVSASMMYVFASLAIVSFLFFLSITMIIASGTITMMIR